MSLINIQNVVCMQNIQQLNDILSFKIRFDCLENINQEIEWKVTFISDPSDNKQDQILDQFVMGPLQKGTMEFQIQVDSPNYSKVSQILEVSGLTISCSFYDQVFFICGYYVNHYIQDEQYRQWYEEQVQNGVQVGLDLQKVVRHIDSQNPRVTNCKIEWENPSVCGLQINGCMCIQVFQRM